MVVDETEIAALVGEIERYLVAVAAFRAEGHDPEWRPEWPPLTAAEPAVGAVPTPG
jgi:hypothetical protein